MQFILAFLNSGLLILRLALPIFFYIRARDRHWPAPALWVLFGLFEPLVALMFYYLLVNFLPPREDAQ